MWNHLAKPPSHAGYSCHHPPVDRVPRDLRDPTIRCGGAADLGSAPPLSGSHGGAHMPIPAITGSALLTVVATAGLAAPASADETPAPVVVNDTISLYPFETGAIDVLANDSSPSGQDLALCR